MIVGKNNQIILGTFNKLSSLCLSEDYEISFLAYIKFCLKDPRFKDFFYLQEDPKVKISNNNLKLKDYSIASTGTRARSHRLRENYLGARRVYGQYNRSFAGNGGDSSAFTSRRVNLWVTKIFPNAIFTSEAKGGYNQLLQFCNEKDFNYFFLILLNKWSKEPSFNYLISLKEADLPKFQGLENRVNNTLKIKDYKNTLLQNENREVNLKTLEKEEFLEGKEEYYATVSRRNSGSRIYSNNKEDNGSSLVRKNDKASQEVNTNNSIFKKLSYQQLQVCKKEVFDDFFIVLLKDWSKNPCFKYTIIVTEAEFQGKQGLQQRIKRALRNFKNLTSKKKRNFDQDVIHKLETGKAFYIKNLYLSRVLNSFFYKTYV
jgi:hypothetical protein